LLGERNVRELRRRVYGAVMNKEIKWFDVEMGAEGNVQTSTGAQSVPEASWLNSPGAFLSLSQRCI
jgi:hypothetical protein